MQTIENPLSEGRIKCEIGKLLTKKDYPCVAALQSFHSNDYWIEYIRILVRKHILLIERLEEIINSVGHLRNLEA